MEANLPGWILNDNQNRQPQYKRDVEDELFLRNLNDLLSKYGENSIETGAQPVIFFFGVPRCGKTFFSQMIIHLLDLGYPDNIVARFWKAPFYGIRLSKILRKSTQGGQSFDSDYGKTKGLFDPHDFAYFWHEHLLKSSHPYDYQGAKHLIDWDALGKSLALFTSSFGKTCIFKGVNPSYHINEIASAYPKSLFIYLQRDFIDSAYSLYKGRVKNYGDRDRWYGQTPLPEVYNELKFRPYFEQIAGQFKYLTELYENQLDKLDSSRYLIVNYENFCKAPEAVSNEIVDRVRLLFGETIVQRNSVPVSSIRYSTHNEEEIVLTELRKGLEIFGLQARFK